jgi:pyocin large subunit-like protein
MLGMRRAAAMLAAGAAAAALAGCDNGPSAVARDDRAEPQALASVERGTTDRSESRDRDGPDHRGGPALQVDGKAMWAATRRYPAEEGARRSFERNGEDFGAESVEAYVRKARAFVSRPPSGVERMERPNGDTLFYDADANIFAVADKAGLPKTMFKPRDGAKYWKEQKDRDARRQTARRTESRDEG